MNSSLPVFLFLALSSSLIALAQGQGCPFGFDRLRKLQSKQNEPSSIPTSEPSSTSDSTIETTDSIITEITKPLRVEQPSTSSFLDFPPLTGCKEGFCVPPAKNGYIGGYFQTSDGGSTSNNSIACFDVLPPDSPLNADNQSHAQLICLQLAAEKACERNDFINGSYCSRTCGVCTQPIWSNGVDGSYSGPNQLLENGLYNSSRFLSVKIPRVKCDYYDPNEVSRAIIEWAGTNPPNLDIPKLNRLAFHDAADYNKWIGTGGPDGNVVMGQEMYYGQSHNLPLKVKASLAPFKNQFGERLSWADLIQIAGMTAGI